MMVKEAGDQANESRGMKEEGAAWSFHSFQKELQSEPCRDLAVRVGSQMKMKGSRYKIQETHERIVLTRMKSVTHMQTGVFLAVPSTFIQCRKEDCVPIRCCCLWYYGGWQGWASSKVKRVIFTKSAAERGFRTQGKEYGHHTLQEVQPQSCRKRIQIQPQCAILLARRGYGR